MRPQELKELARFLWEKGRSLTHATEKDAVAWVRTLKQRMASRKAGLDSLAIFRKIAVARGFFERLKGNRSPNPFGGFRTRRSDRPVPTALPLGSEQLRSLLETMNPESPWGRRNRAIAILRFSTKLSVAEICRLRKDQLVLRKIAPAIRLARTGGTLERIPLRGAVLTTLRKHLRTNPSPGPHLFQAMPDSLTSPKPRGGRRPGQPLSARWVRSMLRKAGLEVGLSIRGA